MGARIAQQVAKFERPPTSVPTVPAGWKTEVSGKAQQKIDYKANVPNMGANGESSANLDYSHNGSMNFDSQHGVPAVPPHMTNTGEKRAVDSRLNSAMSFRSEEYYTPDEYPRSWRDSDESNGQSNLAINEMYSQSQSMRPHSRGDIPPSNPIQIEQLPPPQVLNRLSKHTNEPVLKLAELINADDESLDLDNSYLSKPDGFYTHSRDGSTHSAISLAEDYKSDIPASPFEMESPEPNTGSFPNESGISIAGIVSRDLTSDTRDFQPAMHSDSRPVTSRTMRTSELAEVSDSAELPRMPSVKSRPSQSQSDDSGYSSANTSLGFDYQYDYDPRNGSYARANGSSSPLDASIVSLDASNGYPYPNEYTTSNQPVDGYIQYQNPARTQTRDVSPITAEEAIYLQQAPAPTPRKNLRNPKTRPKSHHELSYAPSTSSVPLPGDIKPKYASRSQNDLLNSALTKSISSLGLTEQPKRSKSTDKRKKSLRNVFGLFRKSEKPEEKPKSSLTVLMSNKSANQSRISVMSTRSDKTTGGKDGSRTPRKLQKKKSRPLTGYSSAAASKSELMPEIPTDLQQRFGEREGLGGEEQMPTTIGMSYDGMQRSKTPMMHGNGEQTTNLPNRPLPAVPGLYENIPQARPRPQETLSNAAKNPDKRFSLNRLRSKSSPQAIDDEATSRLSDDFIDETEFPTGYFSSVPMVNGPDGFSGSPYDVAMMMQQRGAPPMPKRHSMMNYSNMPRVPPIPGRFSQYGPPPPRGSGSRAFRQQGMGPGAPGPGPSQRARPMSYHGVVRTVSGQRRRMEVLGETDEDGYGSNIGVRPIDDSMLEPSEPSLSRTPSYASYRGDRSERRRSDFGMAVTSPGSEASLPLGYDPFSQGAISGPGPASFHSGYPTRMSSNGSAKRMSMPIQYHKSNPDLREEMKRNSIIGLPMNHMSVSPRSPHLEASSYRGPPRTGSPHMDPNSAPNFAPYFAPNFPPRSPHVEGNDYLGASNSRPISRSSSIRSSRSIGTRGPRPYPGSVGPSSRTPSMASMMMDSINTHIGGGPYPTLPGREERDSLPDKVNPYAWQPRSGPQMDGAYPSLPTQTQMRSHDYQNMGRPRPKSAMMMGGNVDLSNSGYYPPNHRDSYAGPYPNTGQKMSSMQRNSSIRSYTSERWGQRPLSAFGPPSNQRPKSSHSQKPFSSTNYGYPMPVPGVTPDMGVGADLDVA
jgi:hypothetical protein